MLNSQLTYSMIEEMEELVQEVDTQIKALENQYLNKLFFLATWNFFDCGIRRRIFHYV